MSAQAATSLHPTASTPTTPLHPPRPFMPDPRAPFDPPDGLTFAEFLRSWNHSHIARWLADIKCAAHADAFHTHEIQGDLLLELDQQALKEMNITSIGDRIRILNAVKALRQRAASKVVTPSSPSPHTPSPADSFPAEVNGTARLPPRKEHGRPPPLRLQPNANKGDLPDIIREPAPDSATRATTQPPVRPLPLPGQTGSTPASTGGLPTPGGVHRTNLPPLPPPPRGQPPPPPAHANRSGNAPRPWASPEAPAYTSQPLPPTPQSQPQNQNSWSNHHHSSSASGNIKVPARSTSPLPPHPPRIRGPVVNKTNLGTNSPSNSPVGKSRLGNHPYASAQATLHPPNHQAHNLSPIEEAFSAQANSPGTPSPPSHGYTPNRPPFNQTPSLDDIKKKIVKFVVPDEGTTITIDVANCTRGQEVIEKVLKKIGKGGFRGGDTNVRDNPYSVDGWSIYHDSPSDDGPGEPLSESHLLAICSAPDHPARKHGLTVRKVRGDDRSTSPLPFPSSKYLGSGQTTRAAKRASAISILSVLGVDNPETALASDPPSPSVSINAPFPNAKRPSKLRNFFGQRPPSELIAGHLPEYFPMAEKKVLRTARHSMLMRHGTLAKRQSTASSLQQPVSRFSTSTQGSQHRSISPSRASFSSLPPPPLPEKNVENDPIPRMSFATEDGHSIDLQSDEGDAGPSTLNVAPQLLPPIPTGDFSDSMEAITRPLSRTMSINSKRLSYLSELRSNRDRSDTASMMTVDEITAEVESRRVSKVPDVGNPDLDDWTKVGNEDDDTLEGEEEEEGTTLNEEEAEEDDDEDSDDDFDIAIPARTANKWIKGALIGAGSFGKVYLGMDAINGLLMAVKQVELPAGSGPNQERKKSMLSALETEIELLKNLQHENIVQYLYSSLDDEHLNIFLEYVPGGSVATLLSNYGAFEEPLVRNFVHQILQGLDYLHSRDIIHRDIKGANILVDNKGGVKISDFGISKKVDANLLGGNRLHRPSLQGSVFWMAPEVVKQTGHTKKADIWSVGCLVVEMLTGEHPWAQLTQMQAIFKIGSSAKPAIPSDISTEAQEFLQCTFEINHEARPPAPELLQHPWIAKKSKKANSSAAKAEKAEKEKAEKDCSPAIDSSIAS